MVYYAIIYKEHAVAQMAEALRYKPEGGGFDSRWAHSGRTIGLGFDPASKRNRYQEYFLGGKGGRCVRLTTLQPSCVDCLEIWEPNMLKNSGPVQACCRIALPLSVYTINCLLDVRNVLFTFIRASCLGFAG